jgi:hypothetical protein
VSQASVSRLETGKVTPSVATLEKILDALEAPNSTRARMLDHLHALLSELSSWDSVVRTGLRRKQEEVRKLEAASKTIRTFQAALIPGLLQTASYAERILTLAGERWGGASDIEAAVAARLQRQGLLMDTSKTFDFVVMEPVFRGRICPAAVMATQLERLIHVAGLPNVNLAILPSDAEMPAVPLNSFVQFDDRLVIVETFTNELVLRDPRDVGVYMRTFEDFRAASLNRRSTQAKLRQILADLRAKGSD